MFTATLFCKPMLPLCLLLLLLPNICQCQTSYETCQKLNRNPFVVQQKEMCEMNTLIEVAPPVSSPVMCLFATGHSWDHYLIFAMNEINSGRYPNLDPILPISYRILLANITSPYPEGEVQQHFSTNYQNCSIFVGPAWTVQASAIGELAGIVKRPLVSGGASGLDLSLPNFNYFTRVIPNDVGLLDSFVALILRYDMQRINIVCINDEYGRTMTEALIRRAEGLFTIELVRCYDVESTNETMAGILDDVQMSVTGVTFLSMVSFQTPKFLNLAGERGMHDNHLWLSAHATQVIDQLDPIPTGAWGLAYGEELREEDSLAQRYKAKDTDAHHDALCTGCNDYDQLTYWGSYAYDAVLTAANALNTYYVQQQKTSSNSNQSSGGYRYSGQQLLYTLRNTSVPNGHTGVLTMDANGDRVGARIPLFYLTPNGTEEYGVYDSELHVTNPPMWPGGGFIPLNLIRTPPQDNNYIDDIRWFGWTLAVIVLLTSLFFIGWTYKEGQHVIIRKSQPFFLHMICTGTLLMGSSIFPLGIDDSIATVEGCNIACMAFPWLFASGFTFSFSALFSKIWRINKLFYNPGFRRIKVTERDVLQPFFALFGANVTFLLIWTLTDPLLWTRKQLDPINSYGRCEPSDGHGTISIVCGTLIAVTNGFCLISANYQAYRARNLCDEFSESKYIAIAMASMFQLFIIGAPLVFLVDEIPKARFFVYSGMVFIICMSLNLVMFVPKMMLVKNHKSTRKSTIRVSGASLEAGSFRAAVQRQNSVMLGIRVTNKALLNEDALFRLEEKLKERGINTTKLFQEVGLQSAEMTNADYSENTNRGDTDYVNRAIPSIDKSSYASSRVRFEEDFRDENSSKGNDLEKS